MSDVTIRVAHEGEHRRIDELAVDAWQVLSGGYDPPQWAPLIARIGAAAAGIARTGEWLVAATEAELLGAVAYVPAGRSDPSAFPRDWPVMRMLVVRPSARGRGVGKALAVACVQRARADGASCIGLHTSPIMTVALPMYLRMGFVRDGDLPAIAGAPYARYVLRFDRADRGLSPTSTRA
jgi:GNAT superfamily N-acetyltransferase